MKKTLFPVLHGAALLRYSGYAGDRAEHLGPGKWRIIFRYRDANGRSRVGRRIFKTWHRATAMEAVSYFRAHVLREITKPQPPPPGEQLCLPGIETKP